MFIFLAIIFSLRRRRLGGDENLSAGLTRSVLPDNYCCLEEKLIFILLYSVGLRFILIVMGYAEHNGSIPGLGEVTHPSV